MKNIASQEEIRGLKTTDIYFLRVREILEKLKLNPEVIAEITCSSRSLPWIILSGLDDLTELLEGRAVDVHSLPEGTVFPSHDMNGIPIPALRISGKYLEFGLLETPLLGSISQASGIATKASYFKKRIGNLTLLSFGVRRMHPSLAPLIDRNGYIGGCDKVSSIIGAERIGKQPEGTMPHSLLLLLGEEEGWKRYAEVMKAGSKKTALVDTYSDEKEASLRAARIIDGLDAIRLDTPASRRGNFPEIVREVRWELDRAGFEKVAIVVSGGVKEEDIEDLKKAGVSAFGIGTAIANSPTIDFAMDIVSIDGKNKTKKGKYSGKKEVFRCPNCHSFLVSTEKSASCPNDNANMEPILEKVVENGKILYREDLDKTREYVLSQLRWYQLSS